MTAIPTRTRAGLFVLLFLMLSLSCSKDTDLFQELNLYDKSTNLEDSGNTSEDEEEGSGGSEEDSEGSQSGSSEDAAQEGNNSEDGNSTSPLEQHSHTFLPLNDAYIQAGTGYNQELMRLEESHRTSYLMFDLEPLKQLDATLDEVELVITVGYDEGNGLIKIHKGANNDWDEHSIDGGTAPEPSGLLGSIEKSYKNGTAETIRLDELQLAPEILTLVLIHENGNDLAFASKEHGDKPGPRLIVKYKATEALDDSERSSEETSGSEEEDSTEAGDNTKPTARVNADPTSGSAPLQVNFSGVESSDDQGITAYHWDFGDGSSSEATEPSHTFTDTGTYNVTLTVTDESGQKDTSSVTIEVWAETSNEAPNAVASSDITSGDAPLEVNFNAGSSSDDTGIVSYHWDFDDGTTSSTKNPSHIFEIAGEYKVKLTVTDDNGATDSDTITIQVNSSTEDGSNSDYGSDALIASTLGFNTSNATEAFYDAINSSASTVVIDKQSGDWLIEPTKFFNIKNKKIIFEEGVIVRAKSNKYGDKNDRMIQFINAEHVEIEGYGAVLMMNKSEYTDGEGRHALSIIGCTDFSVRGLYIKDSGGDGIYLAGSSAKNYSENIVIEDVICDNNRRQGMSIISAEDVYVRNSEFINSSGTKPETGVDLEPNNPDERLVNINFENCLFAYNRRAGFKIASAELNGSSLPISVYVRDSEFRYNSQINESGFFRSEIYLSADRDDPVKGDLLFENVIFNGSDVSILFSRNSPRTFHTTFRDCKAYNIIQSWSHSPISLDVHDGSNDLGGFTFDNFYMEYNKDRSFIRFRGPSDVKITDVNGSFTIKEPGDNGPEYDWGINPDKGVNFNLDFYHKN